MKTTPKAGTRIEITGHAGMRAYARFGSRRATQKIVRVDDAGGSPRYLVRAGGGMLVGLRRGEFRLA